MPILSIVYPCYNEVDNLEQIVRKTQKAINGRDIEVILVDNGSTDDTPSKLPDIIDSLSNGYFRTVRVDVNKGYGFGIMSGVRVARGEVICWTHADLQVDPHDVIAAYDFYVSNDDWQSCILKGKRTGRGLLDSGFTLGMTIIASSLLGVKVSDINAQPKMFFRSFLEHMPSPPSDFSLDLYTLYIARRHNVPILEYPLSFGKRIYGDAKGGGGGIFAKFRLIYRTWSYILRLRNSIGGY